MEKLTSFLQQYQPKLLGQQKAYAVLLPLIEEGGEWKVLYQLRSQHISQPGEVSFPGGALEEGEEPWQAALRETVEELEIAENQIKILGEIDYLVQQGRTIHCFVGRLTGLNWREIRPNQEVERVFAVPLWQLQAQPPVYYTLRSQIDLQSDFPFERIRGGSDYDFSQLERRIPFYEQIPEGIWGMTAQLTHHFVQLLERVDDKFFIKNQS